MTQQVTYSIVTYWAQLAKAANGRKAELLKSRARWYATQYIIERL